MVLCINSAAPHTASATCLPQVSGRPAHKRRHRDQATQRATHRSIFADAQSDLRKLQSVMLDASTYRDDCRITMLSNQHEGKSSSGWFWPNTNAADASERNAVADARIRDFLSAFIKVTKAYGTIELMAVRHRIGLKSAR
jgi:serine protease inhibitor ecotin